MPKFPTFPYLFDEANCISISKFRKWGYLKPDTFKTGIITWTTNEQETGKISIQVIINDEVGTLNY